MAKLLPLFNIVVAVLATSACAAAIRQLPPLPEPAQGWVRMDGDSVITLRRNPPADPAILRRGGTTIFLSVRDLERYFAGWPGNMPVDVAQLSEQIRREYSERGWVELGEGMLEDIVAARLIERGQAAIRAEDQDRFWATLRMAVERRQTGTSVTEYRVFYTPEGAQVLRVIGGTTVS